MSGEESSRSRRFADVTGWKWIRKAFAQIQGSSTAFQ